MNGEEWKQIDEKHFVSNKGRVKSYCKYNAIILKPQENEKGYLLVSINQRNIFIHRLVAFAFCTNGNEYDINNIEIHHIDKNRKNNNADNLMILTNTEHRKLHQKRDTKQ